jgi:branched-chain amino acid transport system substrate-binding protein
MARARALAVVGVVVAVGAMGLLGCSDDSGGGSSGTDSAPPPAETGPPVNGAPVEIGVVYSEGVSGIDLPGIRRGAEAAVDYINSELGGFDGHPGEVVACNDRSDPAADNACAQEFIDNDVVAVAGASIVWGDNGLGIAGAEGIPYVGLPVSNAEFVAPTSYPFDGGPVSGFPALAKYFAEDVGIDSAVILIPDIGAAELAADALIAEPLEERGVTDVKKVTEQVDAADFSSAVVAATEDDPDVVFVLFADAECRRIFDAAQQLGTDATLTGLFSCAPPAGDEADAEGGVFSSGTLFYDDSNEDAAAYQAAMARYDDDDISGVSATAFSQVMTLRTVIEQIGVPNLSRAALLDALDNADGIPVFMGTKLDKDRAASLAGIPTHVYNPDARIIEVQDGELVDVGGGWVDGFTG